MPTVSVDKRRAFIRAYADARRDLDTLSEDGATALAKMLQSFSTEARNILNAHIDDYEKPFSVQLLPQIQTNIAKAVESLNVDGNRELQKAIRDAYRIGSDAPDDALEAAGYSIAFPTPSEALLVTLSRDAGSLMTEFTTDLDSEIMNRVRRSALSLEPASTTMNDIKNMLETSAEYEAGLRQRVGTAYQAEEILRTETNRAYSSASHASIEKLSKYVPDMKKTWMASPGARQGHEEAGDRYGIGGEIGPIPINEKFEVRDYSRTGYTEYLTLGGKVKPARGSAMGLRVIPTGGYQRSGAVETAYMAHPLDPSAGPGFVCNCRCTELSVVPGFEDVIEKGSKAIYESITVREGGSGSGNFGHAERAGEVGGSGEGGLSGTPHGEQSSLMKNFAWSAESTDPGMLKSEFETYYHIKYDLSGKEQEKARAAFWKAWLKRTGRTENDFVYFM